MEYIWNKIKGFTFPGGKIITLVALAFCILLPLLFYSYSKIETKLRGVPLDTLVLLVPDGKYNEGWLSGWENVAAEEGLHLQVMTDSEFLRSYYTFNDNSFAGVILPDGLHKTISNMLIERLKKYVFSGGQLMLVFDAGTLNHQGVYFPEKSPFSEMVGTDYASYPNLGSRTTALTYIGQDPDKLSALGIPPGKYIHIDLEPELGKEYKVGSDYKVLSTYQYGPEIFSHYSNDSENLSALLVTPEGHLIANVSNYGKGHVLFINLPLTYLWSRTDALLMHTFLRYFAIEMLNFPVLSTAPKGIGGIIMNLHLDCNATIEPLQELKDHGVFKQGPYSVDITAGPDCFEPGDGQGLDVDHNPVVQKWIHYFQDLGYSVGDHGGWIHNYFGLNINDDNASQFEKYIPMNTDALEKVMGKKVIDYSAPVGNQPNWVTRYLENNNFIAYYTTGNTGVGATRQYRDGKYDKESIWSFPILPLGQYAAFEEFAEANLSNQEVAKWLVESTQFMAANRVVRLIYYHPPGAVGYVNGWPSYINAMKTWLTEADRLQKDNKFKWYTMPAIAKFMDARRNVDWQVLKKGQSLLFKATHPVSLEDQAWLLRKEKCLKPTFTKGNGDIQEDEKNWIVVASNVASIEFQCNENSNLNSAMKD